MLRSAFAQVQMLELGCAGAAQGNANAARGISGPPLLARWRDVFERNFDTFGLFGAAADGLYQPRELLFAGRLLQDQRIFLIVGILPGEAANVGLVAGNDSRPLFFFPRQRDGVALQILHVELRWE